MHRSSARRGTLPVLLCLLLVVSGCAGALSAGLQPAGRPEIETTRPEAETTRPAPASTGARDEPEPGLSAAEIRSIDLCEAIERQDEIAGRFVYATDDGRDCEAGEPDAESLLLCDAIYDSAGELRRTSDGPTTEAIVQACPEPDVAPRETTPTQSSLSAPAGGAAQPPASSCDALPGSGRYFDPLRLGRVDGRVVVVDCAPLTSGDRFNVRYFSFTLSRAAPQGSAAGARFTLTQSAPSAVHPRLAGAGGQTLARSTTHGFWTGTDPNFTGRYLNITGLPPGTYLLGLEKLDSPTRSLRTPPFDVVVSTTG